MQFAKEKWQMETYISGIPGLNHYHTCEKGIFLINFAYGFP